MGDPPFPQWIDRARPLAGALATLGPLYLIAVLYYGGSPQTTDVGYQPRQPLPFSHAVHAGELGIDCRYCHTTVETAAHAAIPSTGICMNCHERIATESEKLLPVRQSRATGEPIPWVRVHDLPDYVYFDHSAHVWRGVGCDWCHGAVDRMAEVAQVETLSMGWCLDCHRNPQSRLRPREYVTDLDWRALKDAGELLEIGKRLQEANHIHPSTDCSTCHR